MSPYNQEKHINTGKVKFLGKEPYPHSHNTQQHRQQETKECLINHLIKT